MTKREMTKELNLMAFGPARKKPNYLYSRNNLKIMYETDKPQLILDAREKKLKELGYDPNKDKFSKEEFEILLFFDYLEALLVSFRLRSQAASFNAPFADLNGKIVQNGPTKKKWDTRPLIRMLSDFCCSIEICGIEVQALQKKRMPACLEAWRKNLNDQLDHDYAFYKNWKDNAIGETLAGLLKIM